MMIYDDLQPGNNITVKWMQMHIPLQSRCHVGWLWLHTAYIVRPSLGELWWALLRILEHQSGGHGRPGQGHDCLLMQLLHQSSSEPTCSRGRDWMQCRLHEQLLITGESNSREFLAPLSLKLKVIDKSHRFVLILARLLATFQLVEEIPFWRTGSSQSFLRVVASTAFHIWIIVNITTHACANTNDTHLQWCPLYSLSDTANCSSTVFILNNFLRARIRDRVGFNVRMWDSTGAGRHTDLSHKSKSRDNAKGRELDLSAGRPSRMMKELLIIIHPLSGNRPPGHDTTVRKSCGTVSL